MHFFKSDFMQLRKLCCNTWHLDMQIQAMQLFWNKPLNFKIRYLLWTEIYMYQTKSNWRMDWNDMINEVTMWNLSKFSSFSQVIWPIRLSNAAYSSPLVKSWHLDRKIELRTGICCRNVIKTKTEGVFYYCWMNNPQTYFY